MIAIIKKIFEKDKTIKLQIEKQNEIIEDIEMLHPNNIISKPIKDKNVFILDVNKNYSVGLAFSDFNISLNVKEGEIIIYSTDKQGSIKSKMHLTDKGEILTDAESKIITNGKKIELNGNSKNFVTYAELDMALQKFILELGTHTHGSSMGPTSPPVKPISLDISKSKTTTIVTGG